MLRIVFSVLGLLIVLAIVGSIAKNQLKAINTLPSPAAVSAAQGVAPEPAGGERGGRLDAFPGAAAADPSLTVPQQAQNIQQQVLKQYHHLR